MLSILATPLGNDADVTDRVKTAVAEAEIAIVENKKTSFAFLRRWGFQGDRVFELNQHTTAEEVAEWGKFAISYRVILLSDCGTPGFEDPGFQLVHQCRQRGAMITSLPGPSALPMLLSLASQRVGSFWMQGFLPKEDPERQQAWKQLAQKNHAIVLMETPYRCSRFLNELKNHFANRKVLFAAELTTANEWIFEGRAQDLENAVHTKWAKPKLEFMLLVYGD